MVNSHTITLTATEFERRYTGRPYELIEGKAIGAVSPVKRTHSYVILALSYLIMHHVRLHQLGGVVDTEVGYILSADTVVAPDVAYSSAQKVAGVNPDGFVSVPPDLVVEVISPSERKATIERKFSAYQAARIPLIWLIFTRRPRVVVYTYDPVAAGYAQPVTIPFEGMLDGGSVLPGFSVVVSALFPPTENVEGGSS